MNRVIHAAVRRDLLRLESALATAPDGDQARARQLHVAYANLHDQLKRHHEGEDTHVFPFLARVDGATELVGVMETEHQAMADALAECGHCDGHATPRPGLPTTRTPQGTPS